MRKSLPANRQSREAIFAQLDALSAHDADWRHGRVPLYVFKGDEQAAEIGRDAFNRFFDENGLGGKRAFHGLKRMEDEIVEIGLSLFRAPEGATGYFTTGGSESIIAAVKAARDCARARSGDARRRIRRSPRRRCSWISKPGACRSVRTIAPTFAQWRLRSMAKR